MHTQALRGLRRCWRSAASVAPSQAHIGAARPISAAGARHAHIAPASSARAAVQAAYASRALPAPSIRAAPRRPLATEPTSAPVDAEWRLAEYPQLADGEDPAFERDLAYIDEVGRALEQASDDLAGRMEEMHRAHGGELPPALFLPLLGEMGGLLKQYFEAYGVCSDLAAAAQLVAREELEERVAGALNGFTERATTLRAMAGDLTLRDDAFAALAAQLAGPGENHEEAAFHLRFFFGRARRQALHALAQDDVLQRLPNDARQVVESMQDVTAAAQMGYLPNEAPPPEHVVVYAFFLSEVGHVARGLGAPDAARGAEEEALVGRETAEGVALAEARCREAVRGLLRAAGPALYGAPLSERDFALSHRRPAALPADFPEARPEAALARLAALLGPHFGRDLPAALAAGRLRVSAEVGSPAVHLMTRSRAAYIALPSAALGPLALPTLARAVGQSYLEERRREAGVLGTRYGAKGPALGDAVASFFELRALEGALADPALAAPERAALAWAGAQRAADLGLYRPALWDFQRALLRLEGVPAVAAEGALPALMEQSLREWYGEDTLTALPTSLGAVWLAALGEPGAGFAERFGRLAACGLLELEQQRGAAFGAEFDALLAGLGARPAEESFRAALGVELRSWVFWELAAQRLEAHCAALRAALAQCPTPAPSSSAS